MFIQHKYINTQRNERSKCIDLELTRGICVCDNFREYFTTNYIPTLRQTGYDKLYDIS